MGKSRTMGAGLASSTISGVNVNQVQIGDKLQGLAPQATHFFVAGNGKAGWNQYRTRTNGNKRNFVFCMNQLGGVGAGKSQFKIRGLNKPDGTGNCLAGPYSLKDKIEYLRRYFFGLFPDYTLCLVGEHEKISGDMEGCCTKLVTLHPSGDPFVHLTDATIAAEMNDLLPQERNSLMQAYAHPLVRNMIAYVNAQCRYITGVDCRGLNLGVHTLGLVPNGMIRTLNGCGYGLRQWEGLGIYATTEGECTPGGGTNECNKGFYCSPDAGTSGLSYSGEDEKGGICTLCPSGTYHKDLLTVAECTNTDRGYYACGEGNTGQTICPAGTVQPNTTQETCLSCPAGTYSNSSTYSSTYNAPTACLDCPSGKSSIAGQSSCSTGYFCQYKMEKGGGSAVLTDQQCSKDDASSTWGTTSAACPGYCGKDSDKNYETQCTAGSGKTVCGKKEECRVVGEYQNTTDPGDGKLESKCVYQGYEYVGDTPPTTVKTTDAYYCSTCKSALNKTCAITPY